jgi:hypothetical protein
MKKIFLPFIVAVFFLTFSCAGDSNQSSHPDMTDVPDEQNPIIQAEKQEAERMKDSVSTVIEDTEKEIEDAAEKVDDALNKL